MTIQAIQTEYKGYKFRSRLEARWAVFFDALDVRWEYEKEGYEFDDGTKYLPDFWLPKFELFIEVKGMDPSENELHKVKLLREQSGHDVALVIGIPPEVKIQWNGVREKYVTFDDAAYYIPMSSDPESLLPIKDYDETFGGKVCCPICGSDNVHFEKPIFLESDDYKAWFGRGNAIFIPMWCEESHNWVWRLGFHKGSSFVQLEDVELTNYDLEQILAGNDNDKLRNAIKAARSVRFEYGETPR